VKAVCGNKICEETETPETCPQDCIEGFCGDGFCGIGEHPENCKEDCGIVVKPPEHQCPPEDSLKEIKEKCEEFGMIFNLRQAPDGCLYGECNPEHRPFTERKECKEVVEPNGFVRRICEEECFPEPPEIKQRCIEQRGIPKPSTDFRGCPITVCEFGEMQRGFIERCPSPQEIEEKSRQCKESGLSAVIEVGFNGCEYVRCEGRKPLIEECPVIAFEEIERIREECNRKDGHLIREFDERGCGKPLCVTEKEKGKYCRDVPPEAFERCEREGGELIVKKDKEGCVVFEACNRRGERRFEYEEVDEIPDVTRLLSIALKLEDLKVKLEKVKKKINALTEYYKAQGNEENAQRFGKAASMFSSIEEEIERIKDEIKENADAMDKRSVIEIKKEIKLIREKLKDILFVILGETERKSDYTEKRDCGTNEECFQKNYVICNPIKYTHLEGDKKFNAEIKGIENGECLMKVNAEFEGKILWMECRDPYYIDSDMTPEKIERICKGPLTEMIKAEPREEYDYYKRNYRDYTEYKEDLGRNVEGCKESFNEQGNKYITCPVKETEEAKPYNPMTGNLVATIKWRK
jgi:hypothetical protein